MKLKQKIKLTIVLAVEFIAIAVILLLIFLAGKKTYTVTFDLNGGTLMSGELVQEVSQGKHATPPVAVKEGCYLHSWSGSYRQVTKDVVIEAVWEWETSVGLDYISSEDSNYCEIVGCFKDLVGDIYVGVYHDDKKVLGIRDGAFSGCDGIENVYMLDGILSIGAGVFEGCTQMVSVQLPDSLTKLGVNAFKNCEKLEEIVIPEGVKTISAGTFSGCKSLREVVIPSSVTKIEQGAFEGCVSLTNIVIPDTVEIIEAGAFDQKTLKVQTPILEEAIPEGWEDGCFGEAFIEWGYVIPVQPEEEDEDGKKLGWL